MDISDELLVRMYRAGPANVPVTKIGRCLRLLESEEDKTKLVKSLTKRKPRNDMEREIMLYYAKTKGIGGILFIDALGGFEGQKRLC